LKRLKIILQYDYIYYILLIISIFYVLGVTIFFKQKSIYENINNFQGIVTQIKEKENVLDIYIKNKETIIGKIYKNDKVHQIKLGDYITINCKKIEITNNTIPNTFNYKEYLSNKKIFHVVEIIDYKTTNNSSLLYRIKNIIYQKTKKMKKSQAYIETLLFGNKDNINIEINNIYQEIGVSHLFAISGLHINLFTNILNAILKKLKLNDAIKCLITISFLVFYMFLSNFSMSVVRAGIFSITLLINKLLKLNIKSINLLLFAVSMIILYNPYLFYDVGLQYSFVISYFLLLFAPKISGYSYLKKLLMISFLSFVVSFPISIYYFQQINILSIFYNLLFVPYMSFVVLPLSLITYIFPCLDSILYFFICIMEKIAAICNEITISKLILPKESIIVIIAFYITIYLIYLKREKYLIIFLSIILIWYLYPYIKNDSYLLIFDVKQGDSSLIKYNNTITLIDTGGNTYSNTKYHAKNIITYLKSEGIRRIDNFIITHGDFDHMGEAINLVNNFKVEKVIFNCGPYNDLEKELIKVLNKKHIKYYSCIKELNIDKNKLYFLQTEEYDNENDNSNVIYTEINGYKFMLMGDASTTTEKEILNKYNLQDIDVLKVGHHGSKTSSGKEFINEINPKYSIISVDKNNRYGHPSKEVLNNLKDSKIYRTDQDGSIMFEIKNNKLKIETCSP